MCVCVCDRVYINKEIDNDRDRYTYEYVCICAGMCLQTHIQTHTQTCIFSTLLYFFPVCHIYFLKEQNRPSFRRSAIKQNKKPGNFYREVRRCWTNMWVINLIIQINTKYLVLSFILSFSFYLIQQTHVATHAHTNT